MRFSTHRILGALLLSSVAAIPGCGSQDFTEASADGYADEHTDEELLELGQAEEALVAACGGDESNSLAAGLAVAIGKEMGRWDVNTDFVVANGKLELSATGKLMCGSNCPRVTALLRLQDDTAVVPNHSPATYRNKLTSWYSTQKTQLTNRVSEMLRLDQGVYRIRSKHSGKYIVPAAGSISSGAVLQQSDQYSGTTAAQWRVKLNGTRQQLVNIKSGMCMDLQSDSSSSVSIVQRPCNGTTTQDFRLGQLSGDGRTVRSKHNLAFMPQHSSTSNNANIVQNTVTGNMPEHFVFEPYGSGPHRNLLESATAVYSMKVAHTGMGLAVSSSSTADGVTVVQQPFVSTDDRFHWYLTQIGTVAVDGVSQIQYQLMNRRTGKCLDLDGSKRMIQRTCNTTNTQRFVFSPTGNLRQVGYTANGFTMGIQGSATWSGAQLVEESGNKAWNWNNMVTFEPLIAIEPHRLAFSHSTTGGPCGNYDWYRIAQPNGMQLKDAASTWVQLVFAGGKQTKTGTDVNPYIAQQVSGDMVAIDPTYGLNNSGSASAGSCPAACVSISLTSIAGSCCSCQSKTAKFARSAWSATTYVCQ